MTLSVDTISDVHSYGLDVKNRELYLHGYVGNTDEDRSRDRDWETLNVINHLPMNSVR